MANRNVARIERICTHCFKSFSVPPSALRYGALFCSRTCKDAAGIVPRSLKACEQCGKQFICLPSESDRKFCSQSCHGLNKTLTLQEKFWSKVDKTITCWLWSGANNGNGYGLLQFPKGTMNQAHRVSWEIHFGPIPDDLQVCHKCDVRNCVNPQHLFLGTATDNMQDCAKKGRQNSKLNPDTVRKIREQYSTGTPARILATNYHVDRSLIHLIIKRRIWTHVT